MTCSTNAIQDNPDLCGRTIVAFAYDILGIHRSLGGFRLAVRFKPLIGGNAPMWRRDGAWPLIGIVRGGKSAQAQRTVNGW
jgi:hypothetical protein